MGPHAARATRAHGAATYAHSARMVAGHRHCSCVQLQCPSPARYPSLGSDTTIVVVADPDPVTFLMSRRLAQTRFTWNLALQRDTASHGLTTIVTPKSQFRTYPSDQDASLKLGRPYPHFDGPIDKERVQNTQFEIYVARTQFVVIVAQRLEGSDVSFEGEICWLKRVDTRASGKSTRVHSAVNDEDRRKLVVCVVPEKSNAIIGVVTAGFERLPPSCDGLRGSEDHGPMISPVDTPCGYRG
ncbi:5-epiaristolochene 1,3-dihydroxylase-like [Dorcoceras hygrometricum]|uniref:5-epiaristolochene 1,3-dihydroxylase-like n=1 Tax=Dorcoceras hygrometricum TaxID=472368 RepID=A0A2Z7D9Z7_9LAMI|nr:5-epiaristolochene 1,3-dihydroxylase-like [Dorcoceras hygrometricum]